MNSIRRNHFTTITTFVALAIAGAMVSFGASAGTASGRSSHNAGEEEADSPGLVGVWRVQVQSYDCSTNAPLGPPFSSVLTFNHGGTMSGSTTNPAFAPGQRETDQGIWRHEGGNRYRAKDVTQLSFTTVPNPPANPGFQAGSQILSQSITINETSTQFTSKATTEFFDAEGNSYRQGCAIAVASRFE